MALRITATEIRSDLPGCTDHAALDATGWTVTGMPGRVLDRNQAITAMVLAEVLTSDLPSGHPMWAHIANWRAELLTTSGNSTDDIREG